MKLAVMSEGEYISSKYCGKFEECEYLIIYDTVTKQYASRKSPSFYTKDKKVLIDFLKAVHIKHIIVSGEINDKFFKIYKPENEDKNIEEIIIEFLNKA